MAVGRVGAALVAAVTVLALGAGCTREIEGRAAALRLDPGSAGGLPVTDGPSGPREGVPDADVEVDGADGGETDRLATNAVADIQEFWTVRFPADFDARFEPVGRLASYDSNGAGVRICGADTKGLVNAFYCPPEDTIAWDRGELLPSLAERYGPMAVVLVLAHEIGHAVQTRLRLIGRETPTIVAEQQADCFAGAFMRYVAEGRSPHFTLATGNGLNQVLAAIFQLRDQVGDELTARGAHGSAFDRVAAFQFGFTEGNRRCAGIDLREVTSRATELGFDENDDSQGNLPITERTVEAVLDSLTESFQDNEVPEPAVRFDGPQCRGSASTPPASYCPGDNTLAFDLRALAELGTPRNRRDQVAAVGDFAAFGLVASRYVLAVQRAVGLGLTGPEAGLRTACLVGVWAGLHIESPFGGRNPLGTLRLAPGDLDEAVATLLRDGLIASDVDGVTVPSGFARVEAFRIGFLEGSPGCS
ncbi:MAG TPA: neutral zinc metallopeptidase [Pseudonocardiaceae bacterium]